MIKEAIFSDESINYVSIPEPLLGEEVEIKLRVAKSDIKKAELLDIDNYESKLMKYCYTQGYFDYYSVKIRISKRLNYCFRLDDGREILYYNRVGFDSNINHRGSFFLIPDFKIPEWIKGALIYQIFVDRFYNGNKNNDVLDNEYIYIGKAVKNIKDWNKYPDEFDVANFYGGDLEGVLEKLDYLKDLGIEVVYFNPLFVSPSNHKYDTQDYEHIDTHYGNILFDDGDVLRNESEENTIASRYINRSTDRRNLQASDLLFARLVEEMHSRGMKVIMDGVFNHCGSFNKWLDREKIYSLSGSYASGAYEDINSPFKTYFRFFDESREAWPDNDSYDGWWGMDTLPKLNYENSPALCEEIIAIAKKWVSAPYHIDGWRLDVAADLGHSKEFNHEFWRRFRREIKSVNEDIIILAEHYGSPADWLDGSQWDTVMNYDAFMEPVSWFLTGMEKHSDRFDEYLLGNGKMFSEMLINAKANLPMNSLLSAMNELSNHDHSRFLTRTNKKAGRLATLGADCASEDVNHAIFRQGIIMLMTLQGAPTIYYGDEVGVCGWTDPDNRRTYPWGAEDFELLDYHKYMNFIHKTHMELKTGSLIFVMADDDIVVYARVLGKAITLICIYTGLEEREIEIPLWLAGIKRGDIINRIMYTDEQGYNVGNLFYEIEDKKLSINFAPISAMVFELQN